MIPDGIKFYKIIDQQGEDYTYIDPASGMNINLLQARLPWCKFVRISRYRYVREMENKHPEEY